MGKRITRYGISEDELAWTLRGLQLVSRRNRIAIRDRKIAIYNAHKKGLSKKLISETVGISEFTVREIIKNAEAEA